METIGAYGAKTHLPKLLERVSRGEQIIITKHGVPVAVLQPPLPSRKIKVTKVIAEFQKFRDSHLLKGVSIRDMIEE